MAKYIPPIPFDIEYLAEHFGLELAHVKKTELDLEYKCFKIQFDSLEHAETFSKILLENTKCYPRLWSFSAQIEISYSSSWDLLKAAGTSWDGIAPFNLDFLSLYFDLDKEKVASANMVYALSSPYRYIIKFNQQDDSKAFFEHLKKLGLYPTWIWDKKSVSINPMESFSLLKIAAISSKAKLITTRTSGSNIDSTAASSSQFFTKTASSIPTSIHSTEDPFNLEWMVVGFNLNRDAISKAGFDDFTYEIKFKNGYESDAKDFYKALRENNIGANHFDFNNSVCINPNFKEELLAIQSSIGHKKS